MRPTMPQLLELSRLTQNHQLISLPSVNRNSFLFLGKEKVMGTPKLAPGSETQVLFLRSISLSEESNNTIGAERTITMALDELDRAVLDARVSDSASSRLFVNILATDQGVNLSQTLTKFRSVMDTLIAKHATRLLKLRVDEIEVKLRVIDNDIMIPVRLIASSSTGGWLTREVYREYLDILGRDTEPLISDIN
jgi:acetyl-CoA carboxylase/biotin carboxylase 1